MRYLAKYHSWYFKIVSIFTGLTAREITYNNFEISPVVFISVYAKYTSNHAITYTNRNHYVIEYIIITQRFPLPLSPNPHSFVDVIMSSMWDWL